MGPRNRSPPLRRAAGAGRPRGPSGRVVTGGCAGKKVLTLTLRGGSAKNCAREGSKSTQSASQEFRSSKKGFSSSHGGTWHRSPTAGNGLAYPRPLSRVPIAAVGKR
ncbi:hypothetical protein PV04_05164 [Phialophora macrospora]|uniref:Uncharacterized protein n=1 Tax=Phialophora macrospora TaxID=1851006 RepID=A0A0D2E4K1_9EURO|nr:hypothetical protein PV04_05164 [Phialophora macrospora]